MTSRRRQFLVALAIAGAAIAAAGVGALEARLEPAPRMVDVRGDGHFNQAPWEVSGLLGPLELDAMRAVDVELDLEGEGRSLREILAEGGGRVLVVMGSGQVPSARADRLSSPVLRGLLDALNPLRAVSDHTEVECAIALAQLQAAKRSSSRSPPAPTRSPWSTTARSTSPPRPSTSPGRQASRGGRDLGQLDRQPLHPAERDARFPQAGDEAAPGRRLDGRRGRPSSPVSRPVLEALLLESVEKVHPAALRDPSAG